MNERPRHLENQTGRVVIDIAGEIGVTYAPGYLVFIDQMRAGRWQTIAVDPDEIVPLLIETLAVARQVANAEDVLKLDVDSEVLEPGNALAHRLFAAAADLDAVHRSLSVAQVLAAMEMLEAAGLVVMEGETR